MLPTTPDICLTLTLPDEVGTGYTIHIYVIGEHGTAYTSKWCCAHHLHDKTAAGPGSSVKPSISCIKVNNANNDAGKLYSYCKPSKE